MKPQHRFRAIKGSSRNMKPAGSPHAASRFVAPHLGWDIARKTSSFTRAALYYFEQDAASKDGLKIYMRQDDNECGPRKGISAEPFKTVRFLGITQRHGKRSLHYSWSLSRVLPHHRKMWGGRAVPASVDGIRKGGCQGM